MWLTARKATLKTSLGSARLTNQVYVLVIHNTEETLMQLSRADDPKAASIMPHGNRYHTLQAVTLGPAANEDQADQAH